MRSKSKQNRGEKGEKAASREKPRDAFGHELKRFHTCDNEEYFTFAGSENMLTLSISLFRHYVIYAIEK